MADENVLYFFDSTSDYYSDSDEGILTAKPIIDIFNDFIKNELIKNHTLPESETISFLKELISIIQ